MRSIFCLLGLACLFLSCGHKEHADLLLVNGRVYTVDSGFSVAEAFAVKDGKIIKTGKTAELQSQYDAVSTIDAHGSAIFPGFIDAHAHFVGYGRGLFEVGLYDCRDWSEVIARVKKFAAEHPGEPWIRGRGWDQNLWPEKSFPDNKLLCELFPDRPVLLQRIDGHAAVANARALEMAHVYAGQTVTGGTVETKGNKLTGVLIDNAVDLVTKIIPQASLKDYEKWLTAAQKNCFAQGLTTIADCGLMYNDIDAIEKLQNAGSLQMRLYVMLSDDTANYNRYLGRGPYKTDKLFVKGIKAYADGALGSRGACLLRHYNDNPGWSGFLLSSAAHFDSLAQMVIGTDFQLCTHAIGDSGNRVVLNIYNKYLQGKNDKRWRIEHAQVVNERDFDLFGKASVIPSVQPTHATSDMYWAADRIGADRLKGAYAYRQLLGQNGWLPLGTDFPVEDISAVKTFFAAVVRKDAKGFPAGGFQKENALTRAQALRGITIWAAKACFLEQEVGSIEVGKRADFVILDHDLMSVGEGDILKTNVSAAYMDGKAVFSK